MNGDSKIYHRATFINVYLGHRRDFIEVKLLQFFLHAATSELLKKKHEPGFSVMNSYGKFLFFNRSRAKDISLKCEQNGIDYGKFVRVF